MCWICGHDLSRESFDSMTELQSKEIQDQARIIAEKDFVIFNLKRDSELQRERHDVEIAELKKRREKLDWRRIKDIYPGGDSPDSED